MKLIHHTHFYRKKLYTCLCIAVCLCLAPSLSVLAQKSEAEAALEANRAIAADSNKIPGWPTGPTVGAEAAILMDASTGTILYSKNIHKKEYPASTTKILTTLIAAEQCDLDETVTFSHDAVFDTPRDSNHIAMDVGQTLTVEQCLNAILIRSANEVSYALAEHISGTSDWSVFAETMNKRAVELGCLNSHFVNPNGLPDEMHYTTAYDLAMIGKAFFANDLLCRITLSKRLEIPVSDTIKEAKTENNAMQIIPGGKYAYEYLVGCKTGYTNTARYSLVSCAEKNGMKLICVVMRDEAPYQYEDTIALFDYGFNNFQTVNVSQVDTRYNIDNSDLSYGGVDIFGTSDSILSLSKEDNIILPRSAAYQDAQPTISYDTQEDNVAAVINYSYKGVAIGKVHVLYNHSSDSTSVLGSFDPVEEEDIITPRESVIFINIIKICIVLGALVILSVVFFIVRAILRNYHFTFHPTQSNRRRWNNQRKRRRH